MITIYLLNAILIAHFIADFLFQNQFIKNKNESLLWMSLHSVSYGLIFGAIFYAATYQMYNGDLIVYYVILNTILHYGVDIITAIVRKQMWKADDLPANGFFPTMGFDQLLHLLILYHTFVFMLN